jgi:predicted ATPase
LDEGGWEQAYELSFTLHAERAECEYLSGHFEQAEALFNATLARAKTDLERAHVHSQRIVLAGSISKFAEAVSIARTALATLGIDLPLAQDRAQAAFAAELAEVPVNLAGRRVVDLIDAVELTDPEQQAATKILMHVSPALIIDCAYLTPLAAVKQTNISLKYGHSDASAYGYIVNGSPVSIQTDLQESMSLLVNETQFYSILQNLRIIFNTAYPGESVIAEKLRELTSDGYLTKGEYSTVELKETIERAMRHSSSPAAPA